MFILFAFLGGLFRVQESSFGGLCPNFMLELPASVCFACFGCLHFTFQVLLTFL